MFEGLFLYVSSNGCVWLLGKVDVGNGSKRKLKWVSMGLSLFYFFCFEFIRFLDYKFFLVI